MKNDKSNDENPKFSASISYTDLVHLGRSPQEHHGFINIPVYHGSTVLYSSAKALFERKQEYTYTRSGTPTSRNFQKAIARLEGGYGSILCPSGLNAITTSLLAFLQNGDHLLVVDSVYLPTRRFCETFLNRLGIETTFYDPLLGAGIKDLIKANTRVIYTESPGSQTMEIMDIPAIVEAAHQQNVIVITDNTWATSVFCDVLAQGVDITLQAVTKYISGHSDLMMGIVTAAHEKHYDTLVATHKSLGLYVGADDINLAARGLRTLKLRLERHMENGITIAKWLKSRDEIDVVHYPALAGAPGHEIWKRDYNGAGSLFSVTLKPFSDDAVLAMLDHLECFGLGVSWGGFESLVLPFNPYTYRSTGTWRQDRLSLRFYIGLEDPEDLIADLKTGFDVLNAYDG